MTFRSIDPNILYFGTPVAVVSSLNENGETNLAPISSFWALGWTMVLGLLDDTKTLENLQRCPECVVNIPSPEMWKAIEKLAPLTGKDPVPDEKGKQFHFEVDKFEAAGLTSLRSDHVRPFRVLECPVHLEARVSDLHPLHGRKLEALGGGMAVEIEIIRVHMDDAYLLPNDHVDPDKWSPLIYNFRHYFRLADRELGKTFRAQD